MLEEAKRAICVRSSNTLSSKNVKDLLRQTEAPVSGLKLRPITDKKVIQKDYNVSPRLKTMYQYHFNDTADGRLGDCDNRSIEERLKYFKRREKLQNDLLYEIKHRLDPPPPRKYRSDYSKRVTEYMAETSYVGAVIMKCRIHDHSKCGPTPRRCVHYLNF